MATTGELRAIIEELELVDIGEAASYLGEEASVLDGFQLIDNSGLVETTTPRISSDCMSCSQH